LYDPLDATDVAFGRRAVPLESDLSVPLAYFLNQPAFAPTSLRNIAYLGFLNPNVGREIQGLYLLEPYDPNKIPVVFVHGLASSPVTWTDMYNDLRADRDVGRNFQFWFYFYPTGQPFWVSATQFRRDLADALATLDPERAAPRLDEMVLVGHSMGGLLSKLQTIDSRDDYWHLVSDGSADRLQGSDDNRAALLSTVYFKPSPSVRRVVTIGTPHRGSYFANPITRAFTRTVAELPTMVVDTKKQLIRDNPELLHSCALMSIETGVDSLIPDSPFLPLMLESPPAPWVKYNNVIGIAGDNELLIRISGEEGDGVVALASARIPGVESEETVTAGHTSIHRHPKAIREVTRILREHLSQMNGEAQFRLASYGDARPPHLRGPRHGYRLEDHYAPNTAAPVEPIPSSFGH
jgi:pimeloyl-ACP methyl ester carboxylesterase